MIEVVDDWFLYHRVEITSVLASLIRSFDDCLLDPIRSVVVKLCLWMKRSVTKEQIEHEFGLKELYPEKIFGATTFQIRASVATSTGEAAARAKLLADQEERQMELLMASAIEMQLKKMRSKMKHFQELELIMEKEYAQIQHKESILEEWVRMLEQAFHSGIPRWRDSGLPKFLPSANM